MGKQGDIDYILRKCRGDAKTSCLIWEGPFNKKGYPSDKLPGSSRVERIDRKLWELSRGVKLGDSQLLSCCGVRTCVNPIHKIPESPKKGGIERDLWTMIEGATLFCLLKTPRKEDIAINVARIHYIVDQGRTCRIEFGDGAHPLVVDGDMHHVLREIRKTAQAKIEKEEKWRPY